MRPARRERVSAGRQDSGRRDSLRIARAGLSGGLPKPLPTDTDRSLTGTRRAVTARRTTPSAPHPARTPGDGWAPTSTRPPRSPRRARLLAIGGTGVSATPYEDSVRIVEELGEGVGVQITYGGGGHGARLTGNACRTVAVDPYFLDGEVPSNDTSCRSALVRNAARADRGRSTGVYAPWARGPLSQ
ncbi:alpha/beta hydrolase [Streptomyces hypolithicus]